MMCAGWNRLVGGLQTAKVPDLEVIVLGLPFEEQEDSIREYFTKYGDVADVDIKKNPAGKSRGFAFVKFTVCPSFPREPIDVVNRTTPKVTHEAPTDIQ